MKIQRMLDNHEDFARVVTGLRIKVRWEQICWDLWSSKPKTFAHQTPIHFKYTLSWSSMQKSVEA